MLSHINSYFFFFRTCNAVIILSCEETSGHKQINILTILPLRNEAAINVLLGGRIIDSTEHEHQ